MELILQDEVREDEIKRERERERERGGGRGIRRVGFSQL